MTPKLKGLTAAARSRERGRESASKAHHRIPKDTTELLIFNAGISRAIDHSETHHAYYYSHHSPVSFMIHVQCPLRL